jgi:hypothetical protein
MAMGEPMLREGSPQPYERLHRILRALVDVYRPEGVGVWLYAPNRQFPRPGGRGWLSPLELIEAGRLDLVEQAVERMRAGAAT